MNKKIKIDFPDEFFEKLSKVLNEKTWKQKWLDFTPMLISLVTLGVLIYVSCVRPYVKEAHFDIEINREMVLRKEDNTEILDITVSVNNKGETIVLDADPKVIFTEKGGALFLMKGDFQEETNPKVEEKSVKELQISTSNRSFTESYNVKSLREFLGKTKIEIRVKTKGRVKFSSPVDFKEPNVRISSQMKKN